MADTIATITVENNVSFKRLEDGRTEICLVTDKAFGRNQYALRDALNGAGDKLTVKVNKYRKRRSLDANALLWKACSIIADEIGSDKDSVYLSLLKRYGQTFVVKIREKDKERFLREFKYIEPHEKLGTEKEAGYYRVWLGSSTYNTKEMSVLIDGAISELHEMGIEFLSPEEIARCKSEWMPER